MTEPAPARPNGVLAGQAALLTRANLCRVEMNAAAAKETVAAERALGS